MDKILRTLCLALALAWCSSAKAQVTYDGYEELDYVVYFEHAGERDGEYKLLFGARDGLGRHVREWIGPDEYFLGYQVKLIQIGGAPTAYLRRQGTAHGTVDAHIPVYGHKDLSTVRGTFALAGRGDETASAYIGDKFQLGNYTVTLLDLLAVEAKFAITGSDMPTTVALSPTGGLRTELYLLRKDLSQFQIERWQDEYYETIASQIQAGLVVLFFASTVAYGFTLVSWFTHCKDSEPRRRK